MAGHLLDRVAIHAAPDGIPNRAPAHVVELAHFDTSIREHFPPRAVLVRETRADKLQEISTERVRNLQQDRLTPDERETLREASNEALTKSHSPQINRGRHEASLAYSQEHIFERLSVAREHEVLTEALRWARSRRTQRPSGGSLS